MKGICQRLWMPNARSRAAAVALAAAFLLVACKSKTPAPTPSASPEITPARTVLPGQRGPIVKGTVTLSGAVAASGTLNVLYPFADKTQNSCAKIAAGRSGAYVVPLPPRIGNASIIWNVSIHPYNGPGKFDSSRLTSLSAKVRLKGEKSTSTYKRNDKTTAALTVNKDNSGRFDFANLEGPEAKKLSGSAKWTCSD